MAKGMRDAAANLDFETAARLRDEIKRLQATELAVFDDPMARQESIDDRTGGYRGERKYGNAANMPAGALGTRARKPTDADMGPHNFSGGEATPLRGSGMPTKGRSTGGKRGTRALRRGKRG